MFQKQTGPIVVTYKDEAGKWSLSCSTCGYLGASWFGPVLAGHIARHLEDRHPYRDQAAVIAEGAA